MAGKMPSFHQIKTWLDACRHQQLPKFKRRASPIFSFVDFKSGPPRVQNYYLTNYPKGSFFMTPHIKSHLQARDTWREGLPDLHLAWNGGLGPMDPRWNAFPRSAILSASQLTIGVKSLFDRERGSVDELPRRMFSWMVLNTKYTSGPRMQLRHLTLVDETVSNTREQRPEEDLEVSDAIVADFPIIPGLETLYLVFMEHPGPALLDKLRQKLKAHNIECDFTVWGQPWVSN